MARALLRQLLNCRRSSYRCSLALPSDVCRGKLRHSGQLLHTSVHQGSQLAASGVQSLSSCPDSRLCGAGSCSSSSRGARCAGGLRGWCKGGVADHQCSLVCGSRPPCSGRLPGGEDLRPVLGSRGAGGHYSRTRGARESEARRGGGVHPGRGQQRLALACRWAQCQQPLHFR